MPKLIKTMTANFRSIILLPALLICFAAQAQNSKDLAMVVKANVAFQKPAKMNVIYTGVDNPITVYAPNVAVSKLFVRLVQNDSTVMLLRAEDGTYTAHPSMPGFCHIDIYEGTKVISTEQYRCKNFPAPVATLGGKYRGGDLTPGLLKAQAGIVSVLDNFDFEARISMESYKMTYISKGERYDVTQSGTPVFSTQMKGYMDRASTNDVFIFSDIKIKYPNGQTAGLPAISFTIVDGK